MRKIFNGMWYELKPTEHGYGDYNRYYWHNTGIKA